MRLVQEAIRRGPSLTLVRDPRQTLRPGVPRLNSCASGALHSSRLSKELWADEWMNEAGQTRVLHVIPGCTHKAL